MVVESSSSEEDELSVSLSGSASHRSSDSSEIEEVERPVARGGRGRGGTRGGRGRGGRGGRGGSGGRIAAGRGGRKTRADDSDDDSDSSISFECEEEMKHKQLPSRTQTTKGKYYEGPDEAEVFCRLCVFLTAACRLAAAGQKKRPNLKVGG